MCVALAGLSNAGAHLGTVALNASLLTRVVVSSAGADGGAALSGVQDAVVEAHFSVARRGPVQVREREQSPSSSYLGCPPTAPSSSYPDCPPTARGSVDACDRDMDLDVRGGHRHTMTRRGSLPPVARRKRRPHCRSVCLTRRTPPPSLHGLHPCAADDRDCGRSKCDGRGARRGRRRARGGARLLAGRLPSVALVALPLGAGEHSMELREFHPRVFIRRAFHGTSRISPACIHTLVLIQWNVQFPSTYMPGFANPVCNNVRAVHGTKPPR